MPIVAKAHMDLSARAKSGRLVRTTALGFAILTLAITLKPFRADACGGGFGNDAGVTIMANQEIFVASHSGTETYIFQPGFCAGSDQLGLILPVPAPLTGNPTLADGTLFAELDAFTKPTVVAQCASFGGDAGASHGSPDGGLGGGVNVIQEGTVGQFAYSVLQATSVASFTGWLDQNGFVYASSYPAVFQYYVAMGWYFVAFKVNAAASAPPPGTDLCGDLGPIEISFPSPQPVVPAAIASPYSYGETWRIFFLASKEQSLSPASQNFTATVYFSGAFDTNAQQAVPSIASLAQSGDRLTALDVTLFSWSSPDAGFADIHTEADPNQQDYRSQTVNYVYCGDDGLPQSDSGSFRSDGGTPPRSGTGCVGTQGKGCSSVDDLGQLVSFAAILALAFRARRGRRW